MPHVLSLDPSINSIGWAALPYPYPPDCLHILKRWNFNCYKLQGSTLQEKLHKYEKWLNQINSKFHIIYLVAEMPSFHHSQAGHIAARQGWIIQLGLLLGFTISALNCTDTHALISPAMWKGMVPKSITFKKFQRTFTDHTNWKWHDSDNDIVDAIMLMHYWLSQTKHLDT
jgi:hypothetical protein